VRRLAALLDVNLASRDAEALPWSFWLEYWAMAARDPELREHHIEHYQQIRLEIQRSIEAGIASGELRAELDPADAADLIQAAVTGLGVGVAVDAPAMSPKRAFNLGRLLLALMEK
jgi:hypothetical protein